MSVIRFGADEYAAIVDLACEGERCLNREDIAEVAAEVAAANGEAFEASYHEYVDPIRVADLLALSKGRKLTPEEAERALDALNLQRYNLIAQTGEDFGTKDVLDALVSLEKLAIKYLRAKLPAK